MFLVSHFASPAKLAPSVAPPPGCLDSQSPAYVRLPQGVSNEVSRNSSLTPRGFPMSEPAQVLCDYLARGGRGRALRWTTSQRAPPGLPAPCPPKVSSGDESMCSTTASSLGALHSASEEEVFALSRQSSDDSSAEVAPASKQQPTGKALTTLIIRNLPECCAREHVIDLLEQHDLRVSCDFLYLPVDFNTGKTLGYVFLNFVTAEAAELCYQHVNGEPASLCGEGEGEDTGGGATYEVSWTSGQQGLNANIRRYRNNPVMHESVPDKYKPMLFSKGERIPFPAPRRDIRCPQDNVERTRAGGASIAAS